jgi:hypothetical protein
VRKISDSWTICLKFLSKFVFSLCLVDFQRSIIAGLARRWNGNGIMGCEEERKRTFIVSNKKTDAVE